MMSKSDIKDLGNFYEIIRNICSAGKCRLD